MVSGQSFLYHYEWVYNSIVQGSTNLRHQVATATRNRILAPPPPTYEPLATGVNNLNCLTGRADNLAPTSGGTAMVSLATGPWSSVIAEEGPKTAVGTIWTGLCSCQLRLPSCGLCLLHNDRLPPSSVISIAFQSLVAGTAGCAGNQ